MYDRGPLTNPASFWPPYRIPDTAKVRQKMVYASSSNTLRKTLVGLAIEIQGTDFSEVRQTWQKRPKKKWADSV